MENSNKIKNHMSRQDFVAELARRRQVSEEKANEILTAILEILDAQLYNNQPVYFDRFCIQLTRSVPVSHPK